MSNLSDYKKAAQEIANTQPNQASEDKIEEELQAIFDGYNGFIDHEYQGTAYDRTDAINAIKAIIRTEKLKLLAEVRERVVGEDQPDIGDSSHERNILRREEREALTQLEAEL